MYVPAQALLTLLATIQQEGQAALARGENPPWSFIRLLDAMDQRQLGAAITATAYVVNIASAYLERYKFRLWTRHSSSGQLVTTEERKERATWVAQQLASHEKWKTHGHAISRGILWQELKLKINRPEDLPGLQRAMRRLWALLYYSFDRMSVVKMMLSAEYAFVRSQLNLVVKA